MRIGGLAKYSLIDYPSKISCVIFTAGCNFHCPYCHNPGLVKCEGHDTGIDVSDVMAFLNARKKYLDGVVISGGEPTLHRDLPEFCAEIKTLGYDLKIDTNGSQPLVIQHLLHKGLVDYVAMDIKSDPDAYAPLLTRQIEPEAIRRSIAIILESGIPHEFRTTCIKPLTNTRAIRRIAELVNGADMYALQKANPQKVLDSDFFKTQDCFLTDADLHQFETILSESVKQCVIR